MSRTCSPVWIDLGTHPLDDAVSFYSDVFGWHVGPGSDEFGGYRMAEAHGRPVAGMMSSLMGPDGPAEEPQYPTWWTVYLAVDDVEQALADAVSAGGSVAVPAMEVADLGVMAVVTDPAGAAVGLWEAREFPGFEVTGQAGTPVWFEVMSTDFAQAAPFYEQVFGWDLSYIDDDGQPTDTVPTGGIRYASNAPGQEATAGLCEADSFLPPGVPSFWRAYLGVEDTDAAAARINELGGRVLDGPVDSPFGRMATVEDPQGGQFQIITVNR